MSTRIQKIGLINGIKPSGKSYNLSELIQESYKVSYAAKKINNKKLINLTESHLAHIKKDPTNKTLSEDLDVLNGLVKLGKDQTLKDVEEAEVPKKRRKRSVNSSVKPMTKVKESSWASSRNSMSKALKSFRESAKTKVFYKELDKFNKNISKKTPVTMTEAVKLYKASNSCLTHLTVELEKNPSFRKSYRECTKLLSKDNLKLLECIQKGKVPSRSLLESFVTFTNILLECDTPEKLDPKIYEDADLETLDDRDVINEDADMEELDDRDVINEEEEIDDEDTEEIDEDADMEELDDRDVINEEEEIEPSEELEEDDSVSVDLTQEEIDILKSILSKISGGMQEDTEEPDIVDDEEEVPEIDEEDEVVDDIDPTTDIDEEDEDPEDLDVEDDLEEDEDLEDENPEDIVEEEDTEDDLEDTLKSTRDALNDAIDKLSDEGLAEDDEEDLDLELSESAIKRIKKCF